MTEQETRAIVRHRYQHRCGYCGVHEEEAGSLLEIDHFQPCSADGGEEVENLVYCCPTCNRRKGDFWPSSSSSGTHRLLHPQRDDLATLDGDDLGIALRGVIGGLHRDAHDTGESDAWRHHETGGLAAGPGIEVEVLGGFAIDGIGHGFRAGAVGRRRNDGVAGLEDILSQNGIPHP